MLSGDSPGLTLQMPKFGFQSGETFLPSGRGLVGSVFDEFEDDLFPTVGELFGDLAHKAGRNLAHGVYECSAFPHEKSVSLLVVSRQDHLSSSQSGVALFRPCLTGFLAHHVWPT